MIHDWCLPFIIRLFSILKRTSYITSIFRILIVSLSISAEYAEFLVARAKAESDSGSSSEISLSGAESSERQEQRHFKCQFSDDTCKFYVKVHFAHEFAKLRDRVLVPFFTYSEKPFDNAFSLLTNYFKLIL